MPSVSKSKNQSGNTGALAADSVFYVAEGTVDFSTDAGSTYIPFGVGEKIVFSSGLTVHYRGGGSSSYEFRYMAI